MKARHAWVWLAVAGLGGPLWAAPTEQSPEGPCPAAASPMRHRFAQTEMSVPIELVFYVARPEAATAAAKEVFDRLRALNAVLSDWDSESELRRLCRQAGGGKPVPLGEDLWTVLAAAEQVSAETDGAFDATIGPLVYLWRRARHRHELPLKRRLEEAKALVDYRQLRLSPADRSAELVRPGMRLDLGGIAKGFAVAEAMKILRRRGIAAAMVHAGGDIGFADPPPGKQAWRVGVGQLDLKTPPLEYIELSNCYLATSGDLYQYVEIDGTRYSHIVDPKTGLGLVDRTNVSVIGTDGAIADALATALNVLPPRRGIQIIDRRPGFAALILRHVDGQLQRLPSARWPKSAE